MNRATVYLFADTNLLLQCRPLEQLNWDAWRAFDEVRIIVSAPVLREIDYRKNKGGDRVGNRARAASAMFREFLENGQKIVRESDPSVILSVELNHQQSKKLEDRLNYQERDDQLIGIVYEFVSQGGGRDVRLLTHDTTPIFTAKSLDLTVEVIPEDWLLPPENTATEKELAKLKSENAWLRKTEPEFTLRFLGCGEERIERYEITHTVYEPLTNSEIEDLLIRVKELIPIETNFGSNESAMKLSHASNGHIPGMKEKFVPATENEIARYRDESYPYWLDQCKKTLRGLHHTLQSTEPPLSFTFIAENKGTRPATDALVTMEASGNFWICPPARRNDDEDENGDTDDKAEDRICLPRPPAPPRGRWQTVNAFDILGRSGLAGLGLHNTMCNMFSPPMDLLHTRFHPEPRDINAFYYKPKRPLMPQESFSLECDQWRHGEGEHSFFGEIFVHPNNDEAKGALLCRIRASNLSGAISMTVPVRVAVSRVSAIGRAHELINELTTATEFRIGPQSNQAGSSG